MVNLMQEDDDDNSLFLKFRHKSKLKASSFHSFHPNKKKYY
jgi:hypothetical protein